MGIQESLSLPARFEPPHPALPGLGRLVRLLGPVILILLSAVDRLGYQFTMAEIESVIEPDGVADDIGRESMALIGIHLLILPISAS
jgi:hypothetical protein